MLLIPGNLRGKGGSQGRAKQAAQRAKRLYGRLCREYHAAYCWLPVSTVESLIFCTSIAAFISMNVRGGFLSATDVQIPEVPSKADELLAKKTRDILVPHLGSLDVLDMKALNVASEPLLKIPASAARLLVQILDEMSHGNAVKVVPVRSVLTMHEAAHFLNVSHQALIQLLEEEQISYHTVSGHRRISLEELASYQRQLEADRRVSLAELVSYDQELGL